MRGAVPVLLSVHLITIAVTRQVSALNPALRIPVNVRKIKKSTLAFSQGAFFSAFQYLTWTYISNKFSPCPY